MNIHYFKKNKKNKSESTNTILQKHKVRLMNINCTKVFIKSKLAQGGKSIRLQCKVYSKQKCKIRQSCSTEFPKRHPKEQPSRQVQIIAAICKL